MWQSLIDFVSSPNAPYVFCGTIALVFAYALIDGWVRLSATNQSVARALATLASTPTRQSFYEGFELLHDQFAKQPLFAAAWMEFSKSVILDADHHVVLITRRPHDFFHDSSLLAPRINLRLYQAVPGYLISLGLFFTFIGLVAAIAIASSGLQAGSDVHQTQAALVKLLAVASVKFMSSVAGISLSIILSFSQKLLLNHVSANINRFCEAIEAVTQLVTTEQLLHRWLLAQEQTTRGLQHLAEDIATEVTMNLSGKAK